MTTYHEWFPIYPDVSDPDIAAVLNSKEEFRMYSGERVEAPPKKGEKYSNQKLFEKLYTIYDRVLVTDEPGTGKTCLVTALSEALKVVYASNLDKTPSLLKPALYKRAYVVVKGEGVENNFKFELACRCTNNIYSAGIEGGTMISRLSRLTRAVSSYYELTTFKPFADSIERLSDDQIIEQFEGSIFIVDEAHNIIPGDKYEETGEPTRTTDKIYRQMHRLFHILQRSKIVLLTATPVGESPVMEYSYLINLLRPLDSQMPHSGLTPEQIKPYLSGYTTFVRALDTNVDVEFVGEPLIMPSGAEGETKIYKCELSEFQRKHYANIYSRVGNKGIYIDVREAANFIYPDGSIGEHGFKKYVYQNNKEYQLTNEFIQDLEDTVNDPVYAENPFWKYSAKLAAIYELYTQKHAEGKKGFVYQQFKRGAGIEIFSLLLKAFGEEEFNADSSVFVSKTMLKVGICPPGDSSESPQPNIPKARRFAVYHPDLSPDQQRTIRELYDSPANKNGEYIAMLLISPFGKEGISFMNVQWVALNPWWRWSDQKQTIYRGVRVSSHLKLIKPGERLKYEVYQLSIWSDPSLFNIDYHIYVKCEETARFVAPYMQAQREVAIDCLLEKNRNTLIGLQDGTPQCDYGRCNYVCDAVEIEEIDYTGLIAVEDVEIARRLDEAIKRLFVGRFVVFVENLSEELNLNDIVLGRYLNDWLQKNEILLNPYGQLCFVHIANNALYLVPKYPDGNPIFDALVYHQNYPMRLSGDLSRVLTKAAKLDVLTIEANLRTIWGSFKPEERNSLLESALIEHYINGKETPNINFLLDHYAPRIFIFEEPQSQIMEEYNKEMKSAKGVVPVLKPVVGRPRTVILNTNRGIFESSSYNINIRSVRPDPIRVLIIDPSQESQTPNWREATNVELPVYQRLVEGAINDREAYLAANYYGFVLIDDPKGEVLRLMDQGGRGKDINTYKNAELESIIAALGLPGVPYGVRPVDYLKENLYQMGRVVYR